VLYKYAKTLLITLLLLTGCSQDTPEKESLQMVLWETIDGFNLPYLNTKEVIVEPEPEPEPEIVEVEPTNYLNCKPYYLLVTKANRYYWGTDDYIAASMAQMFTESACNRYAESHAGAQGLNQFMPNTGKHLEEFAKCGIGVDYDPFHLKWITYAGVCYNKFLYESNTTFQAGCERYASAMSAYNGGNRWVSRKQNKCKGDCDKSLWFGHVEYMPTVRTKANERENRNYPRKVLIKFTPKFIEAGYRGIDLCHLN
jgi:hypothetical protein